MLLTAPVGFIHQHQFVLNVKVVRAGQISRIVYINSEESGDLRLDSRRQDLGNEL